MKITIFNAIKNRSKRPISPYYKQKDKSFIFHTISVDTFEQCVDVLSENWILSNPLQLNGQPIRVERQKEFLSKYREQNPGAIVLDIDNITNHDDMVTILDIFKKSDFNFILCKSKNWDGVEKFNLKGFIEINFDNTRKNCHNFLSIIHDMITPHGKIDLSAASDVSVQAPMYRKDIMLLKTDSKVKIDNDYVLMNFKVSETKKTSDFLTNSNIDTSKLIHICYSVYTSKGFNVVYSRDNGTINWRHPSEVISPGGYFTYISTPHIMHHNNKDKSFNIFNEIKQTKEGQNFIKELSAAALSSQFESKKLRYYKDLYINEQFISIDDKMKDFINNFLYEGDILKIKSAMGTGKSKIIDEVINQARLTNQKILLISNRISVANDYSTKYNIKTYQFVGDDAWETGEDLIVQLDSLWKYDLRDFDVVILDEFVSLLFQTINAMKDNMRPFNASKLFSILKNKKIVLADAFLSGYEDIFYDSKKKVHYIHNSYKDLIDCTRYSKKGTFVESILEALKNKDDDETVTASIVSNDIMNTIYDICTEAGFRVVKLNSNTADDVKKEIFKQFTECVNKNWDLLLYSPTLTVGVSNMNNTKHHFHYDAGNAIDVISSLQMVKRTRKMKHLHLFLKEITKLEPTDESTLNELFKQNIDKHFKGLSNNGITIEIDDDGNFNLSKIGKFMNKIQAFHNLLENNHKLSFDVLMSEQFIIKNNLINEKNSTIDINLCIKETKRKIKEHTLDMLNMFQDVDYQEKILDIIKAGRSLTDEEKITKLLYEIEKKTFNTSKSVLVDIAKKEIESDYKMIHTIEQFNFFIKKDAVSINSLIDNMLSSGIKSTEFKDNLAYYKDLQKILSLKLQDWYSENNIKEINQKYNLISFKRILKNIGYKKIENRYILSSDIKKFFKYFN